MSRDGELDRAGTGAEVGEEPGTPAVRTSDQEEMPPSAVVDGRTGPEAAPEAAAHAWHDEPLVVEDPEAPVLATGQAWPDESPVVEDPEAPVLPTALACQDEAQLAEDPQAPVSTAAPAWQDVSPVAEDPEAPVSTAPSAWQDETSAAERPGAGRRASIREVALLPLEDVTHVFTPRAGLVAGPPPSGQLLVLTSQRLIAFCEGDGRSDTHVAPIAGLKHVTVQERTPNASNLLQGVLMIVAGIFVYLALGYWLTGQIDGPTIPVIHMDLAPLIALVLVVTGGAVMLQVFFTQPRGAISFQGEGLQFSFPYRGEDAQRHVFELANAALRDRYGAGEPQDLEGEQFEEGEQLYNSKGRGAQPPPVDSPSAEE